MHVLELKSGNLRFMRRRENWTKGRERVEGAEKARGIGERVLSKGSFAHLGSFRAQPRSRLCALRSGARSSLARLATTRSPSLSSGGRPFDRTARKTGRPTGSFPFSVQKAAARRSIFAPNRRARHFLTRASPTIPSKGSLRPVACVGNLLL